MDIEKRLKQLPDIANRSLDGIQPGPSLRYKILSEAKAVDTPRKKTFFPRLSTAITVVSACLVVLVIGITTLPKLVSTPDAPPSPTVNLIDHTAAGQSIDSPQSRLLEHLPQGAMTIASGQDNIANSFWLSQGDNFPLIGVNGKYYRQMSQNPVASDILGGTIGSIENYTQEPALASSQGFISNVVEQGQEIYAINHMGDGMVAAIIHDIPTAFQRISFAGNAILSGENLQDTLGFTDQDVKEISLSNVGTITNQRMAQELTKTLLENATYASSSLGSGNQVLHFKLTNGLIVQMYADDDVFSACGAWDCPGFSKSFTDAYNQK